MYGGFILTFILHSNLLFQYLQPGVRITRRVPLVEQEHLSSPPIFCGVRVARSLVLCVWFVDRCMSFFFWPLRCLSPRFTDSDYPLGIFKLFFDSHINYGLYAILCTFIIIAFFQ